MKSNIPGDYHNPYDYRKGVDELLKFSIVLRGADYLDNANHLIFKLRFDRAFSTYVKTFSLDKIYSKHIDLVQEILKKKYIYTSTYLEELFKTYGGNILSNKDELFRIILSNYIMEEDSHRRPFANLIKDIWEDVSAI